ncbi:ATP-dependent exoDNAse (exonuclease V) beta subunit [Treponema sp. JC4]|uniref:UvrD-helicase domain-containing protein n=1 Tax=Treponema sp. JC4 TaxID=1124982 RepID=UPI00025B0CD2|nr:UvrD-helicase domain-containing protein [Treponema sp. JC4]EID84134.1 ATP-dependent exoDNAse (exonuclease V) beta subunit [Treponema sp. JC4]
MKNVKYISASAGSGKTYSLTLALTNAIKNKEVEPENVILTTFTKAAASEFKEKAKAMLYENGMVSEADRLDQALIGTIHSVAESLILKYWYVLGLSPRINPIAEEDLDFYRNQSLVNLLKEEDLAFLNQFAEEFNITIFKTRKIDYDFWKGDLSKILEYAKNYQIKDFNPSIAYSKEMTRSLVHGGHHIKVNFDLLENILDHAQQLNDADDSDDQQSRRRSIETQRRLMKIKNPSSFRYAKDVSDFVKKLPWRELADLKAEFTDSLATPYASEEVRETLNKYIELMFRLAEDWNAKYQEYKTEHHLIDFADMEEYFYQLLEKDEIAADIKATYKYVFVDEFQDCSPIQVKIFDKLSEIVDHSIWVGDKKQAIYGFRGSDTVLTTAVMDIVKENEKKGLDGCSTQILGYSWRSLPAIVNFTNAVFEKGFSNENKDEVCLEPKRDEESGSVNYWWLAGTNKDSRFTALTANIIDLINKGEKPSDIAVLAKSNDELNDLADYLRTANVPVFIDEGGQSGADTVSLVAALLQLVADESAELPKAQIAFLTEEEYRLEQIIDDKLEYRMIEKPENLFYDNIPLVRKLMENRDRYKLQSVSALVESLIIELDLFNVAKKLNDNVDTSKLLHAIIEAGKAYEDHCALMHLPSSIMGFVAYLVEHDISVSGSTEGVQFFTYHRSKGLEWKTVILLGCDKDILNPNKFIKRNILGTRIIRVSESTKEQLFPEVKISVFPNLFGNSNIPDEWLNPIAASERYNTLLEDYKEEVKRLMYVAMTRPRNQLIIVLNGRRGKPLPMLTFTQLGYTVAQDFLEENSDLFGVGVISNKLENADEDIEYKGYKAENLGLKLSAKEARDSIPRDLQPSSMPGGEVKADMIGAGTAITVTGKADSAALGTCIHDIFCIAENKSDKDITDLVKAYGFESNLPKTDEIKKAWEALTNWLTATFGPVVKQYHELPFTHYLSNGQKVSGSMDFVWETAEGCVIVDYKTFPGKKEELLNAKSDYYVGKYKGQLECYEKALIAAGKKVLAKVIYYPVVGVIVKL